MSYVVLARKWRPRTFSELIGQEPLVTALTCSLNKQKLHHAYLFTGTRGVGKTSVARIFAKALNCEQGISADPCLKCDACLSIEQGRFIDLLEIDGASRTRVEDTKELLENVMYAPTCGRFKIYLIDEVHMLSQHSFNALLKTLEEPPAHVKFLLATTDPQKLPATVLSRCLQFNLKHIDIECIEDHIKSILTKEEYTYDVEAISILAKSASGSMRDALSLLDQALAGSETHLSSQHVKNMLGFSQHDYSIDLLQALLERNPDQLINLSHQIAKDGGYFDYVLEELIIKLHQLSLMQQLSVSHNSLINVSTLEKFKDHFSPEDLQLFYQIALNGREELARAPTKMIGFDMTLLRMYTFQPVKEYSQSPPTPIINSAPKEPEPILQNQTSTPIVEEINCDWSNILSKLKINGLTLNAAENAEFIKQIENTIYLRIEKGHQSLFTPSVIQRIEQSLTDLYASKMHIKLEIDTTTASPAQQKHTQQVKKKEQDDKILQEDPVFQQLKNAFSIEKMYNI